VIVELKLKLHYLLGDAIFFQLENVLVDVKGNLKITDFGLSALPQQFRVRYALNHTKMPNIIFESTVNSVLKCVRHCDYIL
jgi:serine/threonine protein kinase